MTWTCPDCGRENHLVTVCDNCGHLLTRRELRRLRLQQSRLGALLMARRTESGWLRTTCRILYWSAVGLLALSLIPGVLGLSYLRTDASPYVLRADCTSPTDCETDNGVAGVSALRVTSDGLFGRAASPALQDTVYVSLYGPRRNLERINFEGAGRFRIGQRDSLAWLRRASTTADEESATDGRPVTGEFQGQDSTRRTLTVFSVGSAVSWVFASGDSTIPADGSAAPVLDSTGPVSQIVSGGWQLALVILLALAAYLTGGVRTATTAVSGAMSLVLMMLLTDAARGFIARIVGRVATNPDYSPFVGTVLALLAAAAAIGFPWLVVIWLNRRLPDLLSRRRPAPVASAASSPDTTVPASPRPPVAKRDKTPSTASRLASAVAVPLLVILSLAAIDQVLGAVLLGFEF